jgi:hypothetical protein
MPAQPQSSEAERAWALAKDTTSIPALEAFIRRFGDTYYGDLAKVRMAELTRLEAAKKNVEEARAKAEAERQQLALLKAEQDRKLTEEVERQRFRAEEDRKRFAEAAAAKKKADEEERAKRGAEEEVERQRQATAKAAEERKRAEEAARAKGASEDTAERQRLAMLQQDEKRRRDKEKAKTEVLPKTAPAVGVGQFDGDWTINWTMENCPDSGSHVVRIQDGTVIRRGSGGGAISRGTVSASGALQVGSNNWSGGYRYFGTLSGSSGSGRVLYTHCRGTFTARRS